jgi:hypothetical protein
MTLPIPTAKDVIAHLNERLAARGLPYRVQYLSVVPYMNPMGLSNWSVPELAEAPEQDVIEEEIREARWRFPQIYEEY